MNIKPLLPVTLSIAHPMMHCLRLPYPMGISMSFCKLTLPKLDPVLRRKAQITRSGEQVQVIWHQNVIPDQPGLRCGPHLAKQKMRLLACQPSNAVFCTNGHKNNNPLTQIDPNTLWWSSAARLIKRSVHWHSPNSNKVLATGNENLGSAGASPYHHFALINSCYSLSVLI
ncbi:MAG: hypothetical protein JWM16_5441 [Verrucomicrobiales bacterium]|nr:hypothetical protein [Verrucomicrobiales bacterium]